MPIVVLVVVAFALVAPKFTTYAFAVPVLGFTFGGFLWAVGGCVGWASLSLGSFLSHVGLATLLTLVLVSKK